MKYFKRYFQKIINRIIFITLVASCLIVFFDEMANSDKYPYWISWFNWSMISSLIILIFFHFTLKLKVWNIFIIYIYIFTLNIYIPGFFDNDELRIAITTTFSNLGACMIYLIIAGITGGGVHVIILGGLNISMLILLYLVNPLYAGADTLYFDPINPIMFAMVSVFVYVLFKQIEDSIIENDKNKRKVLEYRTEMLNLKIEEEKKRTRFLSIIQSENDLLVGKVISKLSLLSQEENLQKVRSGISGLQQFCVMQGYQINKTENVKWNKETDSGYISVLKTKWPELTQKEQYICYLLSMNFNTQEIAGKLSMSPETIKWYRKKIRKKINIAPSQNLSSFLINLRGNN